MIRIILYAAKGFFCKDKSSHFTATGSIVNAYFRLTPVSTTAGPKLTIRSI